LKNKFKKDLKEIICSSKFHLDKILDTDEKKIQAKIKDHIRPKNKKKIDKYII